jgi:hypothetical protein
MMFRITIVSVFALASVMVASAGQFQVGGATGLTTSYIGSGNCGGGCNDQNNYDEVLFEGLDGTTPAPGSHYSLSGPTVNSTITDSNAAATAANPGGITFAMINDGTYLNTSSCGVGAQACGTPNSSNYWSLNGGGNLQTLTIPVGQYGVNQVWTMLNTNFSGGSNGSPIDRSFTEFLDFGTSGGTVEQSVRINFTNTGDNSTGTGQIQASILCTSIAPCNGIGTPNGGPLQTNPQTLSNGGFTETVDADNLYGIKYNGTGNMLVLNDTGLLLGALNFPGIGSNLNLYLVDVRVEETGNSTYSNEYGAVSALTVVTAAPEPSTVVMFLAGLGAIGFAGFRRRKA